MSFFPHFLVTYFAPFFCRWLSSPLYSRSCHSSSPDPSSRHSRADGLLHTLFAPFFAPTAFFTPFVVSIFFFVAFFETLLSPFFTPRALFAPFFASIPFFAQTAFVPLFFAHLFPSFFAQMVFFLLFFVLSSLFALIVFFLPFFAPLFQTLFVLYSC
jgi:hypothetical protein